MRTGSGIRREAWQVLVTSALLVAGSMASAATPYYVDDARPDDGGSGLSWATAKKTIQAAVDLTGDGDTVWVTNGTYNITTQISIGKGITVRSINGPEVTTVQRTSGTIRIFNVTHSDAVLAGFTIRAGSNQNGAGVRLDAGMVRNCLIRDNAANQNSGQGGGLWMASGTVVSNCVFIGNSAVQTSNFNGSGGAIYAAGGLITDCVFTNNASNTGGAIRAANTNTTIRNCLIYWNRADPGTGGGIVSGTAENCTIIYNSARTSGGTHDSTLKNSIVYNNEARFSTGDNYSGGTFSYSCTTPDPGGAGNVTADPQLESGGMPRTMPGSPCIDAGSDDLWPGGNTDLAGNPRISGARIDMGAYEFQAASLDCGFIADVAAGIAPHDVEFTAYTNGIDPTGLTFYWDFDNNGVWDQQGADKRVVNHTYTTPGLFSVKLMVSNALHESVSLVRENYIRAPATDLYVCADGADTPPYADWATAAATIRKAVDMSVDGCTIWVANGSYGEHVRIKKGITLTSTNGYAGAWLNEASWWPVSVNHSDAVVIGFTIAGSRHGVWHYAGLVDGCRITGHTSNINNDQAGGMRLFGGAVVANSTFDGNSMVNVNNNGLGGGIYAEGGLITHCVFTNNAANSGAAIFVSGSGAIIRNSLIQSNAATSSGGGVFGGIVESSTIVGNTAGTGGGTRNSIVTNSILCYNTADTGPNYSEGSLSYSCATPLHAGEGNIADDPLFVDPAAGDYRLQYKPVISPAIDAGTPPPSPRAPYEDDLAWINTAVDLAGQPRYLNEAVDMGAYEMFVPPAGTVIMMR